MERSAEITMPSRLHSKREKEEQKMKRGPKPSTASLTRPPPNSKVIVILKFLLVEGEVAGNQVQRDGYLAAFVAVSRWVLVHDEADFGVWAYDRRAE